MNKFTIYCTPEQTKRAYKLGAPIITVNYTPDYIRLYPQVADVENMRKSHLDIIEQNKDGIIAGHTPTAEQMCGWLREKGIHIQIMIYGHKSFYCALYKIGSFDDAQRISDVFDNYEQATLAAIDAALDYLEENTNQ